MMDLTIERYVDEVLSFVAADARTRDRLREDLIAHISEAAEREGMEAVLSSMGTPASLAAALTDSLYDDKSQVIRELVRTRGELSRSSSYEYKSRARFMGLPLVHINYSGGSRHGWRGHRRLRVARGIIAIGDVSIGLLSLGGIALGGVCFGGISVGLLSVAGLALGLLSMGGVALGCLAFGGLAVGLYAFGGCAIATHVAVGGYAAGRVAVGREASGLYTHIIESNGANASAIEAEQIRALILQAYPATPEWLLRLFALPFSF